MNILRTIPVFFSLLILNSYAQSDEKKIEFLLKKIEDSKAIFIRNGEEHPAKKAKSHLEQKMKMATKMFWFFGPSKKITVEEFITKIASSSSTTGEIYKIRLKNGKIYSTEEWLRLKLKEYHD